MKSFLLLALLLPISGLSLAGPREQLLADYAAAAKAASPGFSGFSAVRGKAFHHQAFVGGKAETPACTSCHGKDPSSTGQTPAGKLIEPMALSASPARYSDPAKVEKWFKRNCRDVLGRECTPQEKGDWLSFMSAQ